MNASAAEQTLQSAFDRVCAALDAIGSRRSASGDWNCPGPMHTRGDRNPSLSVNQGDQRALIKCQAGCETRDVLAALGLSWPDLFDHRDEPMNGHAATPTPRRVVKRYDYVDETGELLYQVERLDPKGFRQRRPDGNGRWIHNLDGVRRLLYRLPELLQAIDAGDPVFIVEGEKDADAVHEAGEVATCNSGGAGKWLPEFAAYFKDTDVTIVADKDEPGRKHAQAVAETLTDIAKSIRIVEAKQGKDAADHLEAGLTVEDFVHVWPELAPEKSKLHLLSAAEFASDEAPDEIVERMVYAGVVNTLNGASKVGKSQLAKQLAMAVAAGEPFLGLRTYSCPVLLVSLELSAGAIRNRMELIAAHVVLPMPEVGGRFYVAAPTRNHALTLDLTTEPGREMLRTAIGDTGARLVVLDTLYRFLPGRDPNSTADMGVAFGQLNELAQSTGAGLLLLDHVSKGEHLGPVSHSGTGSQVKGGAAGSIILLKRTAREGGGRWSVDVESWFGSWDEPLYYERPVLDDGSRGSGCVKCSPSAGFAFTREKLEELFAKHAQRGADKRAFFPSKRQLGDALKLAGHASGNATAEPMIDAIIRDFCRTRGSSFGLGLPVEIETHGTSQTSPTSFTWLHDLPAAAQTEVH